MFTIFFVYYRSVKFDQIRKRIEAEDDLVAKGVVASHFYEELGAQVDYAGVGSSERASV